MKELNGSIDRSLWQVPEMQIDEIKPTKHRFLVVIPVINEGERLHNLLVRINDEGVTAFADILIVDGGSTDGSVELELLKMRGVTILVTKLGSGRLSAQLRCAYAVALDKGYQGVITIDGNDKDDPVSIKTFVAKLDSGYDFVQASRFVLGGISVNAPRSRVLGIRLVHAPLLSIASGFKWTDTTQGFRAYSAELLRSSDLAIFRRIFHSYELLPYLNFAAPKKGFKCIEVATSRIYPQGEVPTKIKGLRSNFDLVLVLLRTVFGAYNPK